MFSWFVPEVAAFVKANGGLFWHDTIVMLIPPLGDRFIDISYIPARDRKSLIIGLTFGKDDLLIYDPVTGTYRRPNTDDMPKLASVGIWHRCVPWMDWHWDPFVDSLLGVGVYPQLGFASPEKPYELRVVNKTDLFVWANVTFWAINFPYQSICPITGERIDIEECYDKFMELVYKNYYRQK